MTAVLQPARAESRPTLRREHLGAAAVYAVGALLYVVAREYFGLRFTASPLFAGVVMLVAGYFRPRSLASAVLLLTWGSMILLAGHGPLAADRSTPLYIAAFGLGALLLRLLRRWIDPRMALENIASVMLGVGIWFYLDFDYPVLERVWVWGAWLLLNAAALVALELARAFRSPPPGSLSAVRAGGGD